MRRIPELLAFSFMASTAFGCVAASEEPKPETVATTTEALESDAPTLPSEVIEALKRGDVPKELLDKTFTLDHFVKVGSGRKIHVTETFTLRSWLRWPHRAIVMLPGPITPGEFYQIDVDGYRGRDLWAKRGFFAFTGDFEGTGKSTYPIDGRTISIASQVDAFAKVLHYVRATRWTPKVDLLGESWGGGVVAELCADHGHVRSCTLASMLYKTPSSFADMTFRSPGFHAFLDTLPNGYFDTAPWVYAGLLAASTPDVQTWGSINLPGKYQVTPLYDVFDLPFFTPNVARAPGLIVQGELDPNQSIDDSKDLARDYGTKGARLEVIVGAGHIPRIEAPPSNEKFWSTVVGFIDP